MEITVEHEEMQQKLEEIRNQLENEKTVISQVFLNAPLAVIGISADGIIRFSNTHAEQMLSRNTEEIIGTALSKLIPGINPLEIDLRKNRDDAGIIMPWKDSPVVWKSSITRNESGAVTGAIIYGWQFTSFSVTCQWSERIDAVQNFVAKMAHDFNNLLGSVVGYASLLNTTIPADNPARNYIQALWNSTKYMNDVITRMLRFGRSGKPQMIPFDVNDHLHWLCETWQNQVEGISLLTRFAPDIRSVRADWALIEEALRLLLENAIEAMPNGGTVIILTEQLEITGQSTDIVNYPCPGNYIRIQLRDTGEGIASSDIAKAFFPFFSTKKKGRGTGLGLSIAYSLIKSNGGYLTLESQTGKGTTASIYLRLHPLIQTIDIDDSMVSSGTETILIVDDETSVTGTVSEMLTNLGYSVYTANNGEEAIKICREERYNIDLVILDMMMPGMDGQDTYRCLRDIDPKIRVLFTSGFDNQAENAGKIISESPVAGFLPKPYRLDHLSKTIRESLGENG